MCCCVDVVVCTALIMKVGSAEKTIGMLCIHTYISFARLGNFDVEFASLLSTTSYTLRDWTQLFIFIVPMARERLVIGIGVEVGIF
jgi:hypothetical protein